MADYYFNFQGARIDNGSSGIHTFIAGDVQAAPANEAIVTELREIRRKLEKSEPLLAAAVGNLEQAVRAQDKPTISKIVPAAVRRHRSVSICKPCQQRPYDIPRAPVNNSRKNRGGVKDDPV